MFDTSAFKTIEKSGRAWHSDNELVITLNETGKEKNGHPVQAIRIGISKDASKKTGEPRGAVIRTSDEWLIFIMKYKKTSRENIWAISRPNGKTTGAGVIAVTLNEKTRDLAAFKGEYKRAHYDINKDGDTVLYVNKKDRTFG